MTKNCNFIDKLRDAGLRPTKQRVKICEILFIREKTFHFTINDLAKKISEDFSEKISLATVYNTENWSLATNSITRFLRTFIWISSVEK